MGIWNKLKCFLGWHGSVSSIVPTDIVVHRIDGSTYRIPNVPVKDIKCPNCGKILDQQLPPLSEEIRFKPIVLSPDAVDGMCGTLCRVVQLLDGWHADGTAWSECDESVRQEVVALQRFLEDGEPLPKKS